MSEVASPPVHRMAVFAKLTPMLAFVCLVGAVGEIIYGYDTASFGGVQAIPAFKRQFGVCNEKGVCALPTTTTAILNSFASIGKFVGCFVAGNFVEHFGHRYGMLAMGIINCLGALLEITAKVWPQFVVGRMLLYFSVALCEVSVTTYQAEIVPASMRAFVVSGLQFFITVGGLIATGVNKYYSTHTDPAGWLVPVGVTFIFPVLVMCGLPFLPDAPRWLLFKGRPDDALATLKRVRPKADVDGGKCEAEIDAMMEYMKTRPKKGSWAEVFRHRSLRRTMTVISVMSLQQMTGQAFVSQYGTVFYISVGLGDKAFTYSLISSALTIIPVAAAMYLLDRIGRRPITIFGGVFMAIWMFLVSGMGGHPNPSAAEINTLVASVMMFGIAFGLTWAPAPYAIAAEVPANDLREKTMALGSAAQSFVGWLVTFVLPYLLNAPYAALGPRVGYIFGTLCCLCSVAAYFIVPETRGRSLEEVDELFERNVQPWNFASAKTSGAAARTGVIERNEAIDEEKVVGFDEHNEDVKA